MSEIARVSGIDDDRLALAARLAQIAWRGWIAQTHTVGPKTRSSASRVTSTVAVVTMGEELEQILIEFAAHVQERRADP